MRSSQPGLHCKTLSQTDKNKINKIAQKPDTVLHTYNTSIGEVRRSGQEEREEQEEQQLVHPRLCECQVSLSHLTGSGNPNKPPFLVWLFDTEQEVLLVPQN